MNDQVVALIKEIAGDSIPWAALVFVVKAPLSLVREVVIRLLDKQDVKLADLEDRHRKALAEVFGPRTPGGGK